MKTNLYLENTVSSQTDILDVVKAIEEIILLQALTLDLGIQALQTNDSF